MTDFTPDMGPVQPVIAAPVARGRAGTGRGWTRYGVRSIALLYLGLLLVLPIALVFIRTFEHGVEPVIKAMTRPAAAVRQAVCRPERCRVAATWAA